MNVSSQDYLKLEFDEDLELKGTFDLIHLIFEYDKLVLCRSNKS